jgi:hydrogenase expression/formation protein HypD
MLVSQVEKHESKVEIAYKRGVTSEGNLQAQKIMQQVFEPCPAKWRGMGEVPDSGLKIRQEFAAYDAEITFNLKPEPAIEPKGCICGEILRGIKTPADCRLFRKVCTPENPIGPCMVSSEGSCSAYFLYGNEKND